MKGTKTLAALMAAALLTVSLTACGGDPTPPNAKTAPYDEMVEWLTQEGYISEETQPIDLNTTKGYITDNTGGSFPTAMLADQAEDYDGLWLFWWDLGNTTEAYEVYQNMKMNSGVMMIEGGAAVLQTAGQNGAYAIAFASDYPNQDQVLEAFEALPTE